MRCGCWSRGPGPFFLVLTLILVIAVGTIAQAGQAATSDGTLTPVVVAVIDTGVDPDAPELAGRLLAGWNPVWGEPDPSDVRDDSPRRHGTRVSQLLVESAGPVPVRILPVKALGPDGTGDLEDVAHAIRWAVRWRGPAGERVRVINLSLGRRMPEAPASLAAAAADAREKGVLLVAAAGNDGMDLDGYYPASLPGVISVGGVRPDGSPDPHSGQGALLTAPEAEPGTSFAAPLVAGGAAVLWSVYPDRSRAEVVEALLQARDGAGLFRMEKALEHLGARAAGNPLLPDSGPPSNLKVYVMGSADILLAWYPPVGPSRENGPVSGDGASGGPVPPPPASYRVWGDGIRMDHRGIAGPALRVTGLLPGRTYTFHVAALDWAGRQAGPDAAITITMPYLPRGVL